MLDQIIDILLDTVLDTLKLIPFLFLTYLLIEVLEHKAGEKTTEFINRSGKFGPVIGGLLGVIPQCGFSSAMSNLYACGVITRGTLIAVFLSTSDEMLPILISEKVSPVLIARILITKVICGILIGVIIDLVLKRKKQEDIHEICDKENCKCEESIWLGAISHTLKITLFIFVVNILLNSAVSFIGEEILESIILNRPVLGEIISAAIGLIPNCAASIVITELYLQGAMTYGAMMAGLLAGSGIGILVLFRMNKNLKDNMITLALLYGTSVILGIVNGLIF